MAVLQGGALEVSLSKLCVAVLDGSCRGLVGVPCLGPQALQQNCQSWQLQWEPAAHAGVSVHAATLSRISSVTKTKQKVHYSRLLSSALCKPVWV